MKEFDDIISAIEKPLLYASRNSYSNLENLKGLEKLITGLSEDGLLLRLNNKKREILNSLKYNFKGYESLRVEEKKERIRKSLRILINFKENDIEDLSSISIQFLKGVGPKIAEKFKKKGIISIEDALYFLPRRYEDRREIRKISSLKPGKINTFIGDIISMDVIRVSTGRRIFEMIIGDETGFMKAKWFQFNEGYMRKNFKSGKKVILSGEINIFRGGLEIHHPDIEIFEDMDDTDFKRIIPIYSETEGLNQKIIRKIMKRVVDEYSNKIRNNVPYYILKRQSLVDLPDAIRRVHFPDINDDIEKLNLLKSESHRSIIFDEFFFLELGLALRKKGVLFEEGISFKTDGLYINRLKEALPFKLTRAQERVIEEIKKDMGKPYPMNRLIQGDVGSGKTIVAVMASLISFENGYQTAIMAPTEILAEQHFLNINRLVKNLGINIVLLTSSIKKSEKERIYKDISEGRIDIIIGTHALIEKEVVFKKLGLGIIDEQHRFGVIQRGLLKKKGTNPDTLVMTATPIPRTLSLTIYGDLDISIIDEMPPGRAPVYTKVYHERDRDKVYKIIFEEVKKGRQAYIIYPIIEESEKLDLKDAKRMYEHLKTEIFPHFNLGLLHGKMKSEEKERIMLDFKDKKISILVATTVIEVGIDIPNASIIVIEHAERFGLSQLHQLRGRVGRGEYPSKCILLAQYKKSDDAKRRLKIMEDTINGFKISEEDLAIRGPGDFIGTRQSGIPDFRVADIIHDYKILIEARKEAFEVVNRDPNLSMPEHRALKAILERRWKGRLELANIG
jgi:ATP-dependent DNA helicase RecG